MGVNTALKSASDSDWHWSIPWGGRGAATVVTGGAYAVDTDTLRTVASLLRNAAEYYKKAQACARVTLWEVQSAVLPLPSSAAATGGGISSTPALVAVAADFYAAKTRTESCLTRLVVGPQSLGRQAEHLQIVANDIDACVQLYEQAEAGAQISPLGAHALQSFGTQLPSIRWLLNSVFGDDIMQAMLNAELHRIGIVLNQDELADAADMLRVIMDDSAMQDWVQRDFIRLAALGIWAQQADTGRESASVEVTLREVAAELDPWVSQQLPDRVQLGSRWVDVRELTPMQRVAQYLAIRASQVGQDVYGERTGVAVTLRGSGQTVRVPPGTKDPFGLRYTVPVLTTTNALRPARVTPPSTVSQTVLYSQELQHSRRPVGPDHQQSGTISVLRTTHADGSRSWMVVVPGTNDWGTGDYEPQDMLTNLQAVGGIPTDMESAVVTALREAGVAPDEPVGLYGHSQGAIVVSNLAADPAVGEKFHITSVLTAGGPTAGAAILPSVQALHLENTGDAVPALDAAPTPANTHRVTVTFDSHQLGLEEYPHSSQVYADLSQGLEEREPAVADWSAQYGQLVGAQEEGAYTEEFLFDVKRELNR